MDMMANYAENMIYRPAYSYLVTKEFMANKIFQNLLKTG